MACIIAHGEDRYVELVLRAGFGEASKALDRECEVGFGGLADRDVHGQIVAAAGDAMLIVGVTEVVAVVIGVVAPIGRGITIEAVALAAIDTLRVAGAGRSAVG